MIDYIIRRVRGGEDIKFVAVLGDITDSAERGELDRDDKEICSH